MQTVTDQDLAILSDLFKSVNGFRPRGVYPADMSVEDYTRIMYDLILQHEDVLEQEAQAHAQAKDAWVESISKIATTNHITFKDAVRWDMQAHDTNDVDHYEYLRGLQFGVAASIFEE